MKQLAAREEELARVFRQDAGSVLAVLIRQFRDFDLAEDALQDAAAEALLAWRRDGLPNNPAAWLVTTARRRAMDRMRRSLTARNEANQQELLMRLEDTEAASEADQPIPDERLRLIFTCCHPALAQDSQVALTLRTLCGLSTAQIARAYLVPEATMAQRLVRAKNKIRNAAIPYEVPAEAQVAERLEAVLDVIYLIFNEGFSASDGPNPTRADLCEEATRLGSVLFNLLPTPEAGGLLALMLLHDSRSAARAESDGKYVPVASQDTSLWDQNKISRGKTILLQCLGQRRPGPFQIQAAISAVHIDAADAGSTDWPQIAGLYAALQQMTPSPVIALNRAVAIANAGDIASGLALLESVSTELGNYQPLYAAKADLLVRNGQLDSARKAYQQAIELSQNEPERAFLRSRLHDIVSWSNPANDAADA
jgi:RNA polymerase sigma-70 factor, ECF subfamily